MTIEVSAKPCQPLCGSRIEMPFTVGVEEEFVLVDPATGRPALTGTTVAGTTVAAAASGVDLQLELSRCQIETSTPVCVDVQGLGRQLGRARFLAAQAASRSGSQLLAVGVPLWSPPRRAVTETPRYRRMAQRFGELTEQVICGCHVHVGLPDRDLAVQVSNHLRPWLPTLLALTANSPITGGADTGYASWRYVLSARWPSGGPPPYFRSAAHHDEVVAMLLESGSILDAAMVYWSVRLSAHLPTVEIRVSDVPATVGETVLVATVIRALVATAVDAVGTGALADPVDSDQLRAACWRSARDGLAGAGLDPGTGRLVPATTLLARLLAHVRPRLEESGDFERTRTAMAAVIAAGNGAIRQRRALRTGGLTGVTEMVAGLTTEGCTTGAIRGGAPPHPGLPPSPSLR